MLSPLAQPPIENSSSSTVNVVVVVVVGVVGVVVVVAAVVVVVAASSDSSVVAIVVVLLAIVFGYIAFCPNRTSIRPWTKMKEMVFRAINANVPTCARRTCNVHLAVSAMDLGREMSKCGEGNFRTTSSSAALHVTDSTLLASGGHGSFCILPPSPS